MSGTSQSDPHLPGRLGSVGAGNLDDKAPAASRLGLPSLGKVAVCVQGSAAGCTEAQAACRNGIGSAVQPAGSLCRSRRYKK